VAEEPVLRDTEAGMFVEGFDEKLAVPKGYGTVGKCSRTDAASEFALDAAELILQILRSART